MKVLITDIENRKSFDIVNIVKLHYPSENILLAGNDTGGMMKLIYKRPHMLRTDGYDRFEEDLIKIINSLKEEEQIIYLAIEEKTTLLFYEFLRKHPEFSSRFKYQLPPEGSFLLSRDKYRLNVFCNENGIDAPALVPFDGLNALKEHFVPLIYKPKTGSGSKGIRKIASPAELDTVVPDDQYFLQHFVGNGITVEGGFYLVNNGKLVTFYSHQRIRTYPAEGGVSVYSQTVENDEIREIGAKLLQLLNWSGWAMIEFMYDAQTQKYMVIEINPRAWGSIMLSEFNNAGFISQYIAMAKGEKAENRVVNTDTFIRWLFPWDVILFLKKKGKISGFWKLARKKTCYIGFTYSSFIRSVLFIMYSVLDMNHLKKVFKGVNIL